LREFNNNTPIVCKSPKPLGKHILLGGFVLSAVVGSDRSTPGHVGPVLKMEIPPLSSIRDTANFAGDFFSGTTIFAAILVAFALGYMARDIISRRRRKRSLRERQIDMNRLAQRETELMSTLRKDGKHRKNKKPLHNQTPDLPKPTG
jgi:hypothetical protein